MLKKYLFISGLLFNTILIAQDTTWVQTFTFDSITNRRAKFIFPEALNQKRFEKVLMYYKLKCSPLTTWDQYDCGEWDYLTYTRVYDHTGLYDSTQMGGNQFLANLKSPDSIVYDAIPYAYKDTYTRKEHHRSDAQTISYPLLGGNSFSSSLPFDLTKNGGRYQLLIKANELAAAGLQAGNIQSLSLVLNSLSSNGELKYPLIALKATSDTTLLTFHKSGFTTVYDASHWSGGSQSELNLGENEFLFYQPFYWNGTDHLIVEFCFQNTLEASNLLNFDCDSTQEN